MCCHIPNGLRGQNQLECVVLAHVVYRVADAAQLKKFNHIIYRYLQRNSEARINLSIIADQQKLESCHIAQTLASDKSPSQLSNTVHSDHATWLSLQCHATLGSASQTNVATSQFSWHAAGQCMYRADTDLDDDVWDIHALAKGWKPDHQLNGVHIVGNHH